MKITEMSAQVYNYVHENGKVSISELSSALGRTERSIGANVTDLQKKGLAVREKVTVEGQEKPVTYVVLTPDAEALLAAED